MNRRHLLALTGSAGVGLLAGCSGDGSSADPDDGTGGGDGDGDGGSTATEEGADETGTFRLLISDQPVAIDEFDSLEVSFDRARVFRGGDVEEDGEEAGEDEESESNEEETEAATATVTPTDTQADNETVAANETTATTESTATATAAEDGADGGDEETEDDAGGEEEEEEEEEEAENEGFTVIDLDGATVDLTQVLGDKAMSVFEGGLPAGRYSKIELYAADVDGIVEGESVEVKIPSGKLQIVKPFEVEAGSTLSFVFDINVVKKGKQDEYNLLPVISESGIAGKDVPVEEVGRDGNAEGSDDTAGEGDDSDDEDADAESDGADDGNGQNEDGQDGNGGPPEDDTATPEDG